jgi:HlyD family secretion protein
MVGKPAFLYGAAALIVIVLGAWLFTRDSGEYETIAVERAPIIQEVSASGNVEPTSQVDLYFKGSGRLVSRAARIGMTVTAGEVLAVQDTAQLQAQLAEMQAGVDVQKARLAQLLAGASTVDRATSESSAENARLALVKALQDAYSKADDAVRTKADDLFLDPYTPYPQLRFSIDDLTLSGKPEEQRLVVENTLRAWNTSLQKLNGGDPAAAAEEAQAHLREVTLLMDYLAGALNTDLSAYSSLDVAEWKVTLSTARANVNTAASALVSATDAYARAKGARDTTTAAARPEDRALYEAQIRQAEAAMRSIEAQLQETEIRAPVSGVVTRVGGEVGEIVGPGEMIASLMPEGDLQVRINISEGNVVDVSPGQKARITLDAFSDGTEWQGTVLEVEPAETIVGGAVYYEAVVAIDVDDPRIRRGMSANVWITTKENLRALVVPASAISSHDGKDFVRVLDGRKPEEHEVTLGISSSDGKVEIVSGVEEGDTIVVGEQP